jgi:hypothetical protein
MDLLQIGTVHWGLLDEEISSAEVEDAINEAHKVSNPGPSGQTITPLLRTPCGFHSFH